MRQSELEKRNHLIKGTPLIQKPKPIDSGRRGQHLITSEENEYDIAYDDFFEFQKDLDEIEASNEQSRRATIYGELDTFLEDVIEESGFITMEEEEDEEEKLKYSPIIMEDYEEIDAPEVFKRCLYVKENGERCKRQAPKNGDLCAAHRKK